MNLIAKDSRITAMGMLVEAYTSLRTVLEQELHAHTGLSGPTFEVLLRLGRSPGRRLRMNDLAVEMHLSPSGLSRLVDRVAAAGLVAREACETDRRGAYAVLTAEGARRLAEALPVHERGLERHLAGALDPAELEQLTALLRRVRDHVRAEAGPIVAPLR